MKELKLGLQLGYWGAGPPAGAADLVAEAERLDFDSIWTAESYGSDALTPLAWWGSATEKVRLGTSLCQISARTPVALATNGTVREARGLTSRTKISLSLMAYCTFISPITPIAFAIAAVSAFSSVTIAGDSV